MPSVIEVTPVQVPSPSGSDNGTAIASPKTPPPAYMPFGPTVILAVLTEKVTLCTAGGGFPANTYTDLHHPPPKLMSAIISPLAPNEISYVLDDGKAGGLPALNSPWFVALGNPMCAPEPVTVSCVPV